ncbi:FKBP-type peptidyl-prolyl cis-trans isomerase [Luedemannella flava]
MKGTGGAVNAGENITVNYVGVSYKTGEEFDSSWKRNEPATFPIGVGQVIQGWDQGLVGLTVGSRVQLDIPPTSPTATTPAAAALPALCASSSTSSPPPRPSNTGQGGRIGFIPDAAPLCTLRTSHPCRP